MLRNPTSPDGRGEPGGGRIDSTKPHPALECKGRSNAITVDALIVNKRQIEDRLAVGHVIERRQHTPVGIETVADRASDIEQGARTQRVQIGCSIDRTVMNGSAEEDFPKPPLGERNRPERAAAQRACPSLHIEHSADISARYEEAPPSADVGHQSRRDNFEADIRGIFFRASQTMSKSAKADFHAARIEQAGVPSSLGVRECVDAGRRWLNC